MSAWTSAVALSVSVALSPAGTVGVAPEDEPVAVDAAVVVADDDGEGEGPEVPEPEADSEEEPAGRSLDDALYTEAFDRFVEGQELFGQRRYLDAGAAFRRSYAAVAVGKTLYNVGLSYEKGGDIVQALEAYRKYLELPDCPAPQEHCAARRGEVRTIVSKLRTKVGELSIEIDDGVELLGIEIRDRIVPPEDFPIILPPGHYEIRERGYGQGDVRIREIDIEPGQVFSLLVVDFNAPARPVPPETTDVGPAVRPANRLTEEERRRRLKIAFFTGVGMTAVSGIAVGVTGGLTLRAYQDQKDRCRGEGVDCSGTVYPGEDRERVDQLRPVTNALVGVTAGLGITTVVLGLFAFSSRKAAGSRASVTRVTPTPGGVRVRF